jgi:hypothetical protein
MSTFNALPVSQSFDGSVMLLTWTGLAAAGDIGDTQSYANYGDKTFICAGNFSGGATVVIEGSNDGINWATLSNRQGTAMTFTGLGMNTSQDKPIFVRPRLTAGTGGANVIVQVACHHSDIPIRS